MTNLGILLDLLQEFELHVNIMKTVALITTRGSERSALWRRFGTCDALMDGFNESV